jgi:hypothetical protein
MLAATPSAKFFASITCMRLLYQNVGRGVKRRGGGRQNPFERFIERRHKKVYPKSLVKKT